MIAVPVFFSEYQALVNAQLDRLVAGDGTRVAESMAYTVRAPSKRVRPVLTLLATEICGGPPARAVPAAAVMELVHASSLILDDLPSMDNAPLAARTESESSGVRGSRRDSCRVWAAQSCLRHAGRRVRTGAGGAPVVAPRRKRSAPSGLIGGQATDLLATDQQITFRRSSGYTGEDGRALWRRRNLGRDRCRRHS